MSTPALTLRPLTPALLPDWLAFFEGPAFADNPEWSRCYCRCFLFDPPPSGDRDEGIDAWDAACEANQNRAPMVEKIRAGAVDGMLAWRGDEVVGWLQFGPVARFCTAWSTRFTRKDDDDPRVGAEGQAALVCFLVSAPHRQTGVGRAMLRASLEELSRRGFRSVLALGALDSDEGAGHLFTGPMSLYQQEGFEVVRPGGLRPMVWRALP